MPIAPYPSPAELYKLRMAELQRLLQQNGTFKSELMEAFLTAAQVSFREHQRNNNNDNHKNNKSTVNNNAKNGNSNSNSETGYSSSINSPTYTNTTSQSPLSSDQILRNKNSQVIDSKVGIIEEKLDNYKISDNSDQQTDNNRTLGITNSEFTTGLKEIKTEPGLDNVPYQPLPDNYNTSSPPMLDAASPFIMPEMSPDTMLMMPDMMGMMDDSMMSNMSMMMGGEYNLCVVVFFSLI